MELCNTWVQIVHFILRQFLRIENSVEDPVVVKNGKIYSSSAKRNGVGLLNIQRCIEDYLGSIIYKYSNQLLVCDIVLNRVDE